MVNAPNSYFDGYPRISLNAHNDPIIVWQGYDGNDMEIYSRVISDSGPGPVIQITSNNLLDAKPAISKLIDDCVYISWVEYITGYHGIMSAKLWVEDSSVELLSRNLEEEEVLESQPHLSNHYSGDIELIYINELDGQDKLYSRNIGNKPGPEIELQAREEVQCSLPCGIVNSWDDSIYIYEGEIGYMKNIVILGPDYIFE